MANPLEVGSVSPPPPNPDAGNPLQSGAPQANAPAPPSHEQTVAALRHFDAIKNEVGGLLKNPALGRSDVKSAIIDSAARLVSQRFMKPEQAVIELSKVPSDPLQQRKFLQQLMAQAVQSEQGILDHHRNTNLGSGDWAMESQKHNTDPDNHMQDLTALASNYGGQK